MSQTCDGAMHRDEKYFSVCELILDAATKGILKKAILSKPTDADTVRACATVKTVGGSRVLQLESFTRDNKAHHENLSLSEGAERLYKLCTGYSQINVICSNCECQLMRAKSGKVTVIGAGKLRDAISRTSDGAVLHADGNNRKKQYILDGGEQFLRLLGISEAASGRVLDKKQAKFRQINRFLEHIRDIYKHLPDEGELYVLDLCCGKSYLSFAVYYYLTAVLGRRVRMVGVDLKEDVIAYCSQVASRLGFVGLKFYCCDINEFKPDADRRPDLVLSLHACDIATDIVIDKAILLEARVILSTPCCHHELNHSLDCPTLDFIGRHSMLRQKLCDAATDALRLMRMELHGYSVDALELIDPDDTPKNVLLRAIKKRVRVAADDPKFAALAAQYEHTRNFLYGNNANAEGVYHSPVAPVGGNDGNIQ